MFSHGKILTTYVLLVGVTESKAQMVTVTVFAEVTVPVMTIPVPAMFVPSLGVATAGIPTVAPVTVAVPEVQVPASSAPPPIEPVVPLMIPDVALSFQLPPVQVQALPVALSV